MDMSKYRSMRTRVSYSRDQLNALSRETISDKEFTALLAQAGVVADFVLSETPDVAVVRRGERLFVDVGFVNVEPDDRLVRMSDVLAKLADIESVP